MRLPVMSESPSNDWFEKEMQLSDDAGMKYAITPFKEWI